MKKVLKRIGLALVAVAAVAVVAFTCLYFTRFQTMSTIEQLTDYADGYNLYRMDVKYDYDLDHLISEEKLNDETAKGSILKEALPFIPVKVETPKYGCSCFSITAEDGDVLMGRNYDFRNDTSCMLVYCEPDDGYKSVGFAAMDNLKVTDPDGGVKQRLTSLAAPFICLDGINKKGLSISVHTLDSDPTDQDTDKEKIFTTLAIRLVLDRAATTQEAVDLLRSYDMHAMAGRDYHFYINDASGDGRAVEWDCHSEAREMKDTPIRTMTNFFVLYPDKVLPNQKNGIYGHGKERYDAVEKVLTENEGNLSKDVAWEALQSAQQLPKADEQTSNTQWSIVYDNSDLTADVVMRRNRDDVTSYNLSDNSLK